MEGTHNEETEAIKEGDEEFEADQGHGETREENESNYPGHSTNTQPRYPQKRGSRSHCRGHTTLRSRWTPDQGPIR
jgi:hypothetical protein